MNHFTLGENQQPVKKNNTSPFSRIFPSTSFLHCHFVFHFPITKLEKCNIMFQGCVPPQPPALFWLFLCSRGVSPHRFGNQCVKCTHSGTPWGYLDLRAGQIVASPELRANVRFGAGL